MRCLIGLFLGTGMLCAAPLHLYVATDGNDAWSGAHPESVGQAGPLATLARARDVIRARRAAGGLPEGAVVELRQGTYYLDQPVEFGLQDSGTAAGRSSIAATARKRSLSRAVGW